MRGSGFVEFWFPAMELAGRRKRRRPKRRLKCREGGELLGPTAEEQQLECDGDRCS